MIYCYYTRLLHDWRIGGTLSDEANYAKQTVEWWYTGRKPWIFFTREELKARSGH